jgi:hypothetical protein
MPWLRRLVVDRSKRRSGLDHRPGNAGFVTDKMALGEFILSNADLTCPYHSINVGQPYFIRLRLALYFCNSRKWHLNLLPACLPVCRYCVSVHFVCVTVTDMWRIGDDCPMHPFSMRYSGVRISMLRTALQLRPLPIKPCLQVVAVIAFVLSRCLSRSFQVNCVHIQRSCDFTVPLKVCNVSVRVDQWKGCLKIVASRAVCQVLLKKFQRNFNPYKITVNMLNIFIYSFLRQHCDPKVS